MPTWGLITGGILILAVAFLGLRLDSVSKDLATYKTAYVAEKKLRVEEQESNAAQIGALETFTKNERERMERNLETLKSIEAYDEKDDAPCADVLCATVRGLQWPAETGAAH